MINLFQENKRTFLLLLILLFILLAIVYFLFFKPLANERDSAEVQVSDLTRDVEALQSQVNEMEAEPIVETDVEKKRLEKKMPVEPEIKNFLLTLQEIELVSGSKIIDYQFTYDGSIPERQDFGMTEEDTNVEDSQGESNNEENEQELEIETEENVSPIIDLPGMPENLRLVTVSMELFSSDYEQFQAFLKEIEKQERVMMISYLEFEQPREMELLETDDESIHVNVDVTTFYYEE